MSLLLRRGPLLSIISVPSFDEFSVSSVKRVNRPTAGQQQTQGGGGGLAGLLEKGVWEKHRHIIKVHGVCPLKAECNASDVVLWEIDSKLQEAAWTLVFGHFGVNLLAGPA